ncbi:uncharacterized protein MYCFIDRAFT_177762 [Pseudocercospora fijiensis CIRAD86]|uniref:Uncharacterized protein n=1 Tax=Pseudocercospora fijiensis (strain CIRAD86) TaxID=383855 RepID=M3ANQ3_PSEFD|nr:uncharacterized protein MYCFIDRAFT_177762 [Pseudocercospora fijiensis CIRAD86]EME79097.1 hypothetical protein MYCFIDRAFT_177762 [Pseudocercospora fijiensis CIRAD86]
MEGKTEPDRMSEGLHTLPQPHASEASYDPPPIKSKISRMQTKLRDVLKLSDPSSLILNGHNVNHINIAGRLPFSGITTLSPATNTVGPAFVTWAPDSNIAPLATAFIYTDESGQATSSSLLCDTDLFSSAYSTTVEDCSYSVCPSQYLDPDCNLYINSLVVDRADPISPTVQIQTVSESYCYVTTTANNGSCNIGCAAALALFTASATPVLYDGALSSLSDNIYFLPDITSNAGSWVGFSRQTVALDQPASFAAGITTTITTENGPVSTSSASSGPTIPAPGSSSISTTSASSSESTASYSDPDQSVSNPFSTTSSDSTTTTAQSMTTPLESTTTVSDLSSTSYSQLTITSYTYVDGPNGQTSSSALTITSTVVVVPDTTAPSIQGNSDAGTNSMILTSSLRLNDGNENASLYRARDSNSHVLRWEGEMLTTAPARSVWWMESDQFQIYHIPGPGPSESETFRGSELQVGSLFFDHHQPVKTGDMYLLKCSVLLPCIILSVLQRQHGLKSRTFSTLGATHALRLLIFFLRGLQNLTTTGFFFSLLLIHTHGPIESNQDPEHHSFAVPPDETAAGNSKRDGTGYMQAAFFFQKEEKRGSSALALSYQPSACLNLKKKNF